MKKFFDGFIILLSIFVIIVTTYFCLDVFEVIDVPEEYSIASLFYSKMDVIIYATTDLSTNIIDSSDSQTQDIKNEVSQRVVVIGENETTTNTVSSEYWEMLEEATRAKTNNEESNIELTEETTAENFYYEQLDEYAKTIYDALSENIDELKTGTYTVDFGLEFNTLLHEDGGTDTLNNSFQLAINALTFDNPDLFYIDVTKMYLLTEITTRAFTKTYEVKVGTNGGSYLSDSFSTEDAVNEALEKTEQVKNTLVEETEGYSTVDKIKTVHDYLVDTIEYDSSAGENIYNIYGALVDKRSVCEGYARSFKYIMDDMGIPCIIACGVAKNSVGDAENHAWNYVQIDGTWYAIDVTWDDPVITGSGIILDYSFKYDYFLKGSDRFFEDHYEDGNIVGEASFKYPTLSTTDYEY